MKSLKNTQTAKNLAAAFAGESQARNRYQFYGVIATKEGFHQIAKVFYETADNERAHAKVFYNYMIEGLGSAADISVIADYPIGLGTTFDNLKYAAEGEYEEWHNAYPDFAKVADEEGFPEIAASFRNIIKVEKVHEAKYLQLYTSIEDNTLYTSDADTKWRCLNCGYIHTGTTAPNICPACKHPKGYFEVSTH